MTHTESTCGLIRESLALPSLEPHKANPNPDSIGLHGHGHGMEFRLVTLASFSKFAIEHEAMLNQQQLAQSRC